MTNLISNFFVYVNLCLTYVKINQQRTERKVLLSARRRPGSLDSDTWLSRDEGGISFFSFLIS
jgi:hypothetical protein